MSSICRCTAECKQEIRGKQDGSFEVRTSHVVTKTVVCDVRIYVESKHTEETVFRRSCDLPHCVNSEVYHGIDVILEATIKIRKNNVRINHLPFVRKGVCVAKGGLNNTLICSSESKSN